MGCGVLWQVFLSEHKKKDKSKEAMWVFVAYITLLVSSNLTHHRFFYRRNKMSIGTGIAIVGIWIGVGMCAFVTGEAVSAVFGTVATILVAMCSSGD